MAIDVICAGCFKRFQVSDQFAGRSGPCPGCKTIIAIPTLEDQLVIQEPENKAGKPGTHTKIDGIARRAGFFQRLEVISLCSLFAAAGVIAFLTRMLQTDSDSFTSTTATLSVLGLLLLSLASSALGYGILKKTEIQVFERRKAFMRSIITAAIYFFIASTFIATSLLLIHYEEPSYMMILSIIGAACFVIATFVPMACFEMEFAQGALHVAVMICITSLFCLLSDNFHLWLLTT